MVNGTIDVAGISAPVEIVRDASAIPHIFGATRRDALVGLGYGNDEVREVFGQLSEDGTVEDLLREALRLLAGRT